MNTIRVMSIIGIVIFLLTIFCITIWGDTNDNDAALGWGYIGAIYGSSKPKTTTNSTTGLITKPIIQQSV